MYMSSAKRWGGLALAVAAAVAFAGEGAVRMLGQLYMKAAGSTPQMIGLHTTFVWLGLLLGSLLWGFMADRFSSRALLLTSLSVTAVSMAGMALQPAPHWIFVLVLSRSFAITGLIPVIIVAAYREASRGGIGRSISFVSASRPFGVGAGMLAGGLLLEHTGFVACFLILALLPVLAILFVLSDRNAIVRHASTQVSAIKLHLRRHACALYVSTVLANIGSVGSMSLIFSYMDDLGISAGLMGCMGALAPASAVISMALFGRFLDQRGTKGMLRLGFAIGILVPVSFAIFQSAWGIWLGFAAMGGCFGFSFLASARWIGDVIAPNRQGAHLGMLEATRGVGGVLGPLAAGALAPLFGMRLMFLMLVGFSVMGYAVVSMWIRYSGGDHRQLSTALDQSPDRECWSRAHAVRLADGPHEYRYGVAGLTGGAGIQCQVP